MAEATALADRAEFACQPSAGRSYPWAIATVGFRRDGCLSVYFDQDPFYQFDPEGGLRRAYTDGFLYRSQGDTLAQLQRNRSGARTTLLRTDLTPQQLREFQQRMRDYLTGLLGGVTAGLFPMQRIVSGLDDFSDQVCSRLRQILSDDGAFLSRSIRSRR